MTRDRCWLGATEPPCIVQLGRYGDLLMLCPAFRALTEEYGVPPTVLVSKQYADVLEGVSYVLPWIVNLDWFGGVAQARVMAQEKSDHVIVPKYWDDKSQSRPLVEPEASDYGTAMWNQLGFRQRDLLSWPLVIDRRVRRREADLLARHRLSDKPLVLYNCVGISSPFGFTHEILNLLKPFRSRAQMIDLSKVRAHRIFDLLGLYDQAAGLITIDTATAHLAPASKVSTIWLTVPTTGRSLPRGNVALHVPYNETPLRLGEMQAVIERWIGS